MDNNFSYFPIFINIQNKDIIIFGAGKIALRRTMSLLNTGCNITIVAPNILEEFYSINYKNLTIIKDFYNKKYIEKAFIVLAITNSQEINNEIYLDCIKNNIIINVASNKEKCDFFFPGVIHKEDYTIGICGNGKNHKLIKNILNKIKNFLG